jgi:hypothetical protein
MIGDCLPNLRCALDHLVYAIAIHESGQSPPPCEGSLAFPICDSPDLLHQLQVDELRFCFYDGGPFSVDEKKYLKIAAGDFVKQHAQQFNC